MIDLDNRENCRLIAELRRVVQRLALISHAPSQSLNLAPPPDDQKHPSRYRLSDRRPPVPHVGSHGSHGAGSSIPRGGIDWKGDKTPEFRQKSHVYFTRTLERWERAKKTVYGPADLAKLLQEAEDTLEAWQKTPLLAGARPAMQDPRWKQWVGECDHSVADIVRWYSCSRQYVHQIRKAYRNAA